MLTVAIGSVRRRIAPPRPATQMLCQERWLECIQWDSLIAERPNRISGTGQIWWGYLKNVSGALVAESFEAEIQLHTKGGRTRVAYSLRFTLDGVAYHVQT